MNLMQQANVALAGTSGQLRQELAALSRKLIETGAPPINPAYGDAAFMRKAW